MTTNKKAEQVVNYTNNRLKNWYANAFNDYGVKGEAVARFDQTTGFIIIETTENGEKSTHVERYWEGEAVDYTFSVWMEYGTEPA